MRGAKRISRGGLRYSGGI
ncbi:bifunctional polymyxin resistance protein ArnA, partial [Yersinia pestis PY-13]